MLNVQFTDPLQFTKIFVVAIRQNGFHVFRYESKRSETNKKKSNL